MYEQGKFKIRFILNTMDARLVSNKKLHQTMFGKAEALFYGYVLRPVAGVGLSGLIFSWAQPLFVKHLYYPGLNMGLGIRQMPDRSFVLTGQYNVSPNDCDVYLFRVDACGNPIWMTRIHAFTEGGKEVAYISGNRVAVTGFYSLSMSYDWDMGISLFDLVTGQHLWTRVITTDSSLFNSWEGGNWIEDDSLHHRMLVAGALRTLPSAMFGAFVKITYQGVVQDVYLYGSNPPGSEVLFSTLQKLPGGDVVLCGVATTLGAGGYDLLVMRIDTATGTPIWAYTIGTDQHDGRKWDTECRYFQGKIYFAATTKDPALDPHPSGKGALLMVVLDTNGNFLWAKTYSGPYWEYAEGIAPLYWGNQGILGIVGTAEDLPSSRNPFIFLIDTAGNPLSAWIYNLGWGANRGVGISQVDGGLFVSAYAGMPVTSYDPFFFRTDSTGAVACITESISVDTMNVLHLLTISDVLPVLWTNFSPAFYVDSPSYTQIFMSLQDSFICFDSTGYIMPHIFPLQDTFACVWDTILIGATATGGTPPYQWQWYPGSRVLCDTCSTTGVVVRSDTDTLIVEVQDLWGCRSFRTVQVGPMPYPYFSFPDSGICLGDTVLLVIDTGVAWEWYLLPSDSLLGTADTLSLMVEDTLVLHAWAMHSTGCEWRDSFVLFPYPLPFVEVPERLTKCARDTLSWTVDSTSSGLPPYSYQWIPAVGLTCSGCLTPSHVDTVPGTYTYIFEATDARRCSIRDTLLLIAFPHPVLNLSVPDSVCEGDTLWLSATITSDTAWEFSWESPVPLYCDTCLRTWLAPFENDLCVEGHVVDARGCSTSALKCTRKAPLPRFAIPDTIVCLGDAIMVSTGYTSPPNQVVWTPDVFVSCSSCDPVVINVGDTLTYVVEVTTPLGCRWKDTFTIFSDPGSPVTLVPYPDTVVYAGSWVRLLAQTPERNYAWLLEDGTQIPETLLVYLAGDPSQESSDTLWFWFCHENMRGCTRCDSVRVIVLPRPPCEKASFWIPNTFTPNQDGKNDVLYVYSLTPVIVREFVIFTRWGEEIFRMENVPAGGASLRSAIGWDGTLRGGARARPDVYVYYAIVDCGRRTYFLKGDVTLIR